MDLVARPVNSMLGRSKPFLAIKPSCNYIIIMDKIEFVWNEAKNKTNERKHEISFEEAQSVFLDEHARLIHDWEHSDEEDRFILLGMSKKFRILIVCHCYREQDKLIRLISARKASRKEQKQYEEFL